jgi:hypothetical protein
MILTGSRWMPYSPAGSPEPDFLASVKLLQSFGFRTLGGRVALAAEVRTGTTGGTATVFHPVRSQLRRELTALPPAGVA